MKFLSVLVLFFCLFFGTAPKAEDDVNEEGILTSLSCEGIHWLIENYSSGTGNTEYVKEILIYYGADPLDAEYMIRTCFEREA